MFTKDVVIPQTEAAQGVADQLRPRGNDPFAPYQQRAEQQYWAEIVAMPNLHGHFTPQNLLLRVRRNDTTVYEFYRVTDHIVVPVVTAADGSSQILISGRDAFTLYAQEVLERAYNTYEIVKRAHRLGYPAHP